MRRGLTLIDLLAATVILSMVASASVALIRDARRHLRKVDASHAGIEVLNLWESRARAAVPESVSAGAMESFQTLRNGHRWRVRFTEPNSNHRHQDQELNRPVTGRLHMVVVEWTDVHGTWNEALRCAVFMDSSVEEDET